MDFTIPAKLADVQSGSMKETSTTQVVINAFQMRRASESQPEWNETASSEKNVLVRHK